MSDDSASYPLDSESNESIAQGDAELTLTALLQRRTSPTACRKCHSRKVKCSGGQPCNACLANKEDDCVYPRRQRVIKVTQEDLESLLREVQQLRTRNATVALTETPKSQSPPRLGSPVLELSAQYPPWFLNSIVPHTPILIGEGSDAGFATRCRNAISDTPYNHVPRLNYPTDEYLAVLSEAEASWPSPPKARMLVNIALWHVSDRYHVVLKSQVLHNLEQNPSLMNVMTRSKMMALFAIGELYSSRTICKNRGYPGLPFFAKATGVLSIMSERPHLDAIEIRLLLSFYSLAINRRYSAYALAGSATRLAVLMGLHLNVSENELTDPALREHRNRVWWTCYSFDRMWGVNLGNPVGVFDNVIDVDLPSDRETLSTDDFSDAAYYIARTRLAQVAGQVLQVMYLRNDRPDSREGSQAQRVQDSLKNLLRWRENLPNHLCVNANDPPQTLSNAVSLYLSFNQCIVMTTRPIFLNILRQTIAFKKGLGPEPQIPQSAISLADACYRCARHNVRLLTDSWADGSFPTFDWLYPQYLFSSAIIIQISSLVKGKDWPHNGQEQIESAFEILCQLRDTGHLAAKEFLRHLEAIKAAITELVTNGVIPSSPDYVWPSPSDEISASVATIPGHPNLDMSGPLLQDLLMQPSLDLQFIDNSLSENMSQGLYWSTITPDNCMDQPWGVT
ncbi:unnamed protein product [Clonostachys rosea f. rosea IK726]|uniref:Zn(2)-C6 fungal-type domain-containing protein n=2 Tax=Bionectria ochroleuca TaxID=29856 RepID=A0A0B7KSJ6_BIOOC|nr:unnamed protein product [Clonostachys rosea f. rosea IK726]